MTQQKKIAPKNSTKKQSNKNLDLIENVVDEVDEEEFKIIRFLNITSHHPIFQYTAVLSTSMQSIGFDYFLKEQSSLEQLQHDLDYYLLHTPIDVIRLSVIPTLEQVKILSTWIEKWLHLNPEGLFIFDYPNHFIDLNTSQNNNFSFDLLDLLDGLHEFLLPLVDLLIVSSLQLQPLAFHEADEQSEEDEEQNNLSDYSGSEFSVLEEPDMLQHEAVYALIELGVKAVLIKGKHENTVKIKDKLLTHEGLIMQKEHVRQLSVPNGLSTIFGVICTLSLAQNRNYCDAFAEGSDYIDEVLKNTKITENSLCDYQKMPHLLFWL